MNSLTLSEFFSDSFLTPGPYLAALEPIHAALTAQSAQHPDGAVPWLTQLGKGGLIASNNTTSHHPEISLYRHVSDVGFLAAYLFFYAATTEHFPIDSESTLIATLRIILTIALFHDADKYCGAPSSSPTLAQIQQVWNDLGAPTWIDPTLWPHFSAETLWHAVSLVERRGHAALYVNSENIPALPTRIGILAQFVMEADRFHGALYRDPRPIAEAWPSIFSEALTRWSTLYGVPKTPQTVFQIHEHPAVLQHLMQRLLHDPHHYPIFLLRTHDTLAFSYPIADVHTALIPDIQNTLTDIARELNHPTLLVTNNGQNINLPHCHDARTLLSVIDDPALWSDTIKTLKIHRKDLTPATKKYLADWAHRHAPESATPQLTPASGQLFTAISPPDSFVMDQLSTKFAGYRRALAFNLALRETSGPIPNAKNPAQTETLTSEKKVQRVLDDASAPLSKPIRANIRALTQSKSQCAILALALAEAITEDSAVESTLTTLREPIPPTRQYTADSIIQTVTDQIVTQLPKAPSDPSSPLDALTPPSAEDAYAWPAEHSRSGEHSGMCLLCGQLTPHPLGETTFTQKQVQSLIKITAFSNRLGHTKSLLDSTGGPNYLCDACRFRHTLWGFDLGPVSKALNQLPLTIVLPTRQIWRQPMPTTTPTEQAQASLQLEPTLSQPWITNRQPFTPLLYTVQPSRTLLPSKTEPTSVLLLLKTLAQYALYSGDPVQVFTHQARPIPTSFSYEPLPDWLRQILAHNPNGHPLYRTGTFEGVSRPDLLRWIQRIDAVYQIAQWAQSTESILALPQWGWWVGASAAIHNDRKKPSNTTAQTFHKTYGPTLQTLQAAYPLPGDFDLLLHQAVTAALQAQPDLKTTASRHQLTTVLRITQAYCHTTAIPWDTDPTYHVFVIAGYLRQAIERSSSLPSIELERVLSAAQSALELVHAVQNTDSSARAMTYLMAAFEVTLREAIRTRPKPSSPKRSQATHTSPT